ncbi:MAG: HAD family hydrolase [Alphaproteobacteria bacterium]|nr:HAD family hydrolase [Alphaproteobacteria bacterium]
MEKPALLIFDCDGVLLDSEALSIRSLVESLASWDVALSFEEALDRYCGRAEVFADSDLKRRYGDKLPDDFMAQNHARLRRFFEEGLKPIPGVLPFVRAWPAAKCVASGSAPDRLKHSLGLTGLWDLFAPNIFSAEQVERGKPAPDLFLFAASSLGVAPKDALVIEDSIPGIEAAQAAGMRSFGFVGASHCRPGQADALMHAGASRVFSSMEDLAKALR